MAFIGSIAAESLPDSKSFADLPIGEYKGWIVASDVITNGEKVSIKLEIDVVDGEYAGRKHWHYLNVKNPASQKAEAIANGQLKDLMSAVGLKAIKEDTQEIHNKRFGFTLAMGKPWTGVDKATGAPKQFPARLELRRFYKFDETPKAWVAKGTDETVHAAPTAAANADTDTTAPWGN